MALVCADPGEAWCWGGKGDAKGKEVKGEVEDERKKMDKEDEGKEKDKEVEEGDGKGEEEYVKEE